MTYESLDPLKIHPLRYLVSLQPSLAFLCLLCSAKKARNLLKKVLIEVLINFKRLLFMTGSIE